MSYSNPVIDAIYKGGAVANQGMSVASSMMQNVQKSLDSSSDLAYKMDVMLRNEEAKKLEQGLRTQEMLDRRYQFEVTQQLARNKLTAQEEQWKTGNNIDKLKIIGNLIGKAYGSSSGDSSRLKALKAEADAYSKLPKEVLGQENVERSDNLRRIAKEIESTQSTQSKVPSSLVEAFNTTAKSLNIPGMKMPSESSPPTTTTTKAPELPSVSTSKNDYSYYPPGTKEADYQKDILSSVVNNSQKNSVGFYRKNIAPILDNYSKLKPEKALGAFFNDERVSNYFTTALSSNNSTVVQNALSYIDNANLPGTTKELYMKKIADDYTADRFKNASVDPTGENAGNIMIQGANDSNNILQKQVRNKVAYMNNILSPEKMDIARQYMLGGSEISDSFKYVFNKVGLTDSSMDDNAKLSFVAKKMDSSTMSKYNTAPFTAASTVLNQASEKAIGDPTQPFYFGSGVFGYSGPEQRIDDTFKTVNPNNTTTDAEMKDFLVPRLATDDSDFEKYATPDDKLSKEQRWAKYQKYISDHVSKDKGLSGLYKANALALSKSIENYVRDTGYQYGEDFKF